ncbi:hypothetical protein LN42_02340 [Marinitoga sp. 1137]|uniref:DUF2828 family protein n=1 Tax=Marinitoga sp. 1137 TaxID=1545835 RepID=UPI0009504947|nr:DUF2828 family protein [Marinitoga sp. 1137]APT75354.1 hypothetical protein LN42_02340 [Marinitoga sp. 1137]
MNKNFMEALKEEGNVYYTGNGALSLKNSGNSLVDFFYRCGILMNQPKRFEELFLNAFAEDKEKAIKILFYSRDVRGGQGVRRTFRHILKKLGNLYPEIAVQIIKYVPEYGRWDDLYAFVGTKVETEAFEFMYKQIIEDVKNYKDNKPISLLAKWLKSENTSSKHSVKLAKITRKYFKMDSKTYRKMLSELRKYIKIVERDMSENKWDNIEYEIVPSRAMKKYHRAFYKHDAERYEKYLEEVKNNKKKINAGTLYPHDIVKMVLKEENETAEMLWKNLPDYGIEEDAIAVVDTSGSMYGCGESLIPITVAVSLGIYFAERNKGKFKNYFITFSEKPELQEIKGETLYEKVQTLSQAYWDANTNIIKVFELILETAKKGGYTIEDIPEKIYIISDMQFDMAVSDNSKTNFEAIKEMYEKAGYPMPQLIFWNVSSYGNDVPVKFDENGTALISGYNPVILKYILTGKDINPFEIMENVINSERYKNIHIN